MPIRYRGQDWEELGNLSLKHGMAEHFIGAFAELLIATLATKYGIVVSYPLFTQSKYDLIFDIKGKLLKIQVKKATKSSANGFPFIQIRLGGSGRPKYTANDYDYLAMVYEDNIWFLPYSYTDNKTSMSFSIFTDNIHKRHPIQEYTFEKFLEREGLL